MSIELPQPLGSYYASVNARDDERVLALFAAEAVVKDEGGEHHGREAIRSWMQTTMTKYGPLTATPSAVAENGHTAVVTSTVSGDFKGSPVTLRYAFTLQDERIIRLEIA